MSMPLYLWMLHISLLPIYIFKSGSVQPSHLVFLSALSVFSLSNLSGKDFFQNSVAHSKEIAIYARGKLLIVAFSLFSLYVTLVNSVWSVILGSFVPFLFSSFQLYNLVLIFFIVNVASRDFISFLKATRVGFIFAIAISVLAILITGFDSASRESSLFNNPNQLGFFCISASMIFIVANKFSIGNIYSNIAALAIASLLCMPTLSRAGIYTCLFLLFVGVLSIPRTGSKLTLIIIIGLLVGPFALSIGTFDKLTERSSYRADFKKNTNSSELEERGYDRIFANPEYLAFGAGEGVFKRFDGRLAGLGAEMHSSVGTILFSYGIIGFLLYLIVWGLLIIGSPGITMKLCAIAPLIYGFTHNGLRFSASIIAVTIVIMAGAALGAKSTSDKIKV